MAYPLSVPGSSSSTVNETVLKSENTRLLGQIDSQVIELKWLRLQIELAERKAQFLQPLIDELIGKLVANAE